MTKLKNKYSIQRRYVTNKNARPRIKNLGVDFLVAHETANNNADADAHYNYFQGITFSASAHTFIDDNKILEIIPLDEKAWHVRYDVPRDNRMYGDDANDVAIGTELCRTGDFDKAYDRYVWYHAYLCKKFGLNPKKDIVAHSKLDPSRRTDPQSWLEPNGVSWNKFINDVNDYYRNWGSDGSQAIKPSNPSKPSKGYRKTATDHVGMRLENIYHTNVNYYNSPRWDNPTGTFKPGHGWTITGKYIVDGSYQYQVKNSKGHTYYVTAHDKYVKVIRGKSAASSKPKPKSFKPGQKVTVKKSASTFATGESIADFVKGNSYTVKQVKSDRVLLGGIMSWVRKSDVY
ncbi:MULTISPECIES: N-acetylmuramoyl-L-alanine amidase [Clostridia]|uniref:peptidoglycan recognition protein family protein n=1 Tax=Clostridia TaxID=186801 RepID=UPI000EA2A125|nr:MULTISPECIES: N-acetylmuramoyl-L-alanine amidase [Clostridia]NBJ71353.1 hypothetical protein [Roseburia sp. 1XD42-34]RKI74034.1 hypothetical protein D7V87_19590 [Clostridium sp. 1xD42-85]